MAALVASDVSYTVQGRGGHVDDSASRVNDIKIVFGDGSKTYPAGGVPLTNLSKNGFPNVVDSFMIQDMANANGYLYKYDAVNKKLRIYQSAGFTPAGTNDGSTPPLFTGTPVAAAALVEVSTSFAPASNVTLYVTVRGH